jgi:hypothetical protein
MTGMIGAMAIGMNTGLTIGIILGAFIQGKLYFSTLLAMASGMLAGVMIGLPIHSLAVLEGLLSGLMGGMMGAMLGAMLSNAEAMLLTKIMLTIFTSTTIILILIFKKINPREDNISLKWCFRPGIAFFLLLFLFIGIDYFLT